MSQVNLGIDPQVMSDVESLETFGYISGEFSRWGRTWTLRTLKGDEDLAIGIITKPYVETMAQGKAWGWAHVALALESINGDTDFCPPLGPDTMEFARTRFKWVTEQYDWFVGEWLFEQYISLQERELKALEAMQSFVPRNPGSSSGEPGSLTDLGISPDDLAPEAD